MPKKLRIGVIFGGRSGEHEVSIRSARSVIEAIDKSKYEVIPIAITKEGNWLAPAAAAEVLPASAQRLLSGQQLGSSKEDVAILGDRSEEHTSELQSQSNHVCRLLLEKKKGLTESQALSGPLRNQSRWIILR